MFPSKLQFEQDFFSMLRYSTALKLCITCIFLLRWFGGRTDLVGSIFVLYFYDQFEWKCILLPKQWLSICKRLIGISVQRQRSSFSCWTFTFFPLYTENVFQFILYAKKQPKTSPFTIFWHFPIYFDSERFNNNKSLAPKFNGFSK